MLADLDLLLIYVFCIADDLLPKRPENARRSLSDAEVVTLCVAQSIMGITSDQRFARTAVKRLGHLFPTLTKRSGFHKRRDRLADTIEALIAGDAHDRLRDTQGHDLGVSHDPPGVVGLVGKEIGSGAEHCNEQQVEVGVHRGPLGRRWVLGSAVFDLPA